MKYRNGFFLCLCFGFLLLTTACSPRLSPFTQNLYEDQGWTNSDLERIQFYLSNDLVLYRELRGGSSEIRQGEIKVVNGQKREVVAFRRGTPGVFIFSPKENRFAVSFEESGNDKYLIFGPSPRLDDRYVLLASDWNRNRGQVTYGGRKWTVDNDAAYTTLMVNLKRLRQVETQSRTVRGRKVNR
ncbi:MAG: hypothetical protein AAGJ82_01850 [Bacteroidota bacterium]